MKSEIQKCLDGEWFNTSDAELQAIINRARKLTRAYNQTDNEEGATRAAILRDLLAEVGDNVNIDTPFYCDYGRHISIGSNVIININCIFVDCNKITIGNKVLIASNVQICTATHPVEPTQRLLADWAPEDSHPFFNTYSAPVTIEDNVWIGASVTVLPGVTIGNNSVIGAGSVVNRSIPANSVAVGNPCRVIRSVELG